MATKIGSDTVTALNLFNKDYNVAWTLGENWTNVATQFETFINKYLFPKLNETAMINVDLGNRFDFLAQEIDFIGQYSEEYVIMDTVPVAMNLSKNEELMLKRNYPRMATKLYGSGIVKKVKFTLNNNDTRFNFATLRDGVTYALNVYLKKISDINVTEEREIRGMLLDYALTQVSDVRKVTSEQMLFDQVYNALLNIQNNSAKYNECAKASGGSIGRYTTRTALKDVAILTTDSMKTYLLNTKIANTFANAGLDITKRIISFDDLGGVYRLTSDVTIANAETLAYFKGYGDYQMAIGDVIPTDSVFTFDITNVAEFKGKFTEIKPQSDLFAYIFDVKKIRYKRNTKGMLKQPFNNPEFDEVTHWLHYYSFKSISPFYNSVVVTGE